MQWTLKHPKMTMEHLGYIPTFFDESDVRPAAAQVQANYSHGGGWSPMKGWTMQPDGSLSYSGGPPYKVRAETKLRDEIIRVYDSAWVAIVQPDGSFEVARLD